VGGSPIQFIDPTGLFVWFAVPVAYYAAEFVVIAGISAYAMRAIDQTVEGLIDESKYNSSTAPLFQESCPSSDPNDWERIPNQPGAYRPKGKKEPIFEADRAGDRAHGGSKWKKWDKKRDWEKGKPRDGTYDENGNRLRD
jgi:hypothetical protein